MVSAGEDCLQFIAQSPVLTLPNDKILAFSIKLKAFAEDKFTVAKMMIFI